LKLNVVAENPIAAFSNDQQGAKLVRNLFRCAAIVLGIAETWATRHLMGADGIAYLDMGDAYWRGDWHMAINALWSPLYSWLLGFALRVLKPSPHWEFPVVHLVNFIVYLGALASFEFLLSVLIDYHRKSEAQSEKGLAGLPPWAWCAIGYTVFLWVSFELVALATVTPDMCVTAFVYLAAGLVLKIRQGETNWGRFAILGVVLGMGYLARTIMFPLALVFLAAAFLSVGCLRKSVPRTLVAAAVFLMVGAPLFVALSIVMGRPTLGEAGRLNHIGFAEDSDYSQLKHPARQIYPSPAAYEFAGPIKGTFPPWYDPAYWDEGIRGHFNLNKQFSVLKLSTIKCYNYIFVSEAGLVAGVFVLLWLTFQAHPSLGAFRLDWTLILPAVAAFGAYSLIFVEGRHIASFIVLLWLGILSAVRVPDTEESRKLIAGVALAVVLTMGGPVVSSRILHLAEQRHVGPVDWEAAQALGQMGIQPGDKVAYIRRSFWGEFFWARLARIQIIAEVPPGEVDKYWAASPAVQTDVLNAFARVGTKVVITSAPPPCAPAGVWSRLAGTDFYAHVLR
jgi:hypothetical protein